MTDHDQAPWEMGEDDGYGFALMARLNEVTMRLKGEWGDPVAWIADSGEVPAPVRSVVRRGGLRQVLPDPEDEAMFFEGFVAGVRKLVDQLEGEGGLMSKTPAVPAGAGGTGSAHSIRLGVG